MNIISIFLSWKVSFWLPNTIMAWNLNSYITRAHVRTRMHSLVGREGRERQISFEVIRKIFDLFQPTPSNSLLHWESDWSKEAKTKKKSGIIRVLIKIPKWPQTSCPENVAVFIKSAGKNYYRQLLTWKPENFSERRKPTDTQFP